MVVQQEQRQNLALVQKFLQLDLESCSDTDVAKFVTEFLASVVDDADGRQNHITASTDVRRTSTITSTKVGLTR